MASTRSPLLFAPSGALVHAGSSSHPARLEISPRRAAALPSSAFTGRVSISVPTHALAQAHTPAGARKPVVVATAVDASASASGGRAAGGRSVLVIGAAGRTGQALVAALGARGVAVHALARDAGALPGNVRAACASATSGDATDAGAVEAALRASGATDAVLCVGTIPKKGDKSVPTARTESGRALARAVRKLRGGKEEEKKTAAGVRVVVVSSLGASGSPLNIGWGRGALVRWVLRKPLLDHDGQEKVLREAFVGHEEELLIVRPTGLGENAPKGTAVVMGADGTADAWSIDRADVADWIAGQIAGGGEYFGQAVGLTGTS